MGTDENTLIEIICSRTPDQLKAITAHYNKVHTTVATAPSRPQIDDCQIGIVGIRAEQ